MEKCQIYCNCPDLSRKAQDIAKKGLGAIGEGPRAKHFPKRDKLELFGLRWSYYVYSHSLQGYPDAIRAVIGQTRGFTAQFGGL